MTDGALVIGSGLVAHRHAHLHREGRSGRAIRLPSSILKQYLQILVVYQASCQHTVSNSLQGTLQLYPQLIYEYNPALQANKMSDWFTHNS